MNGETSCNDLLDLSRERCAHLEAEVRRLLDQSERLTSNLAECYRLSGADPDGNEDRRLAPHAVEEVARLRDESDATDGEVGRLVGELVEASKVIDAARAVTFLFLCDRPVLVPNPERAPTAVTWVPCGSCRVCRFLAALARWDTYTSHVTTADQENRS